MHGAGLVRLVGVKIFSQLGDHRVDLHHIHSLDAVK